MEKRPQSTSSTGTCAGAPKEPSVAHAMSASTILPSFNSNKLVLAGAQCDSPLLNPDNVIRDNTACDLAISLDKAVLHLRVKDKTNVWSSGVPRLQYGSSAELGTLADG